MIARKSHRIVVVLAVIAASIAPVRAVDPAAPALPTPAKLDEAVARGLDYLARQQNPDGSFSSDRKEVSSPPPSTPATTSTTAPSTSPTTAGPPMATTGVVLLALLSSGNAPDLGRHGLVVRRSIDYLLSKIPDDGYVGVVKDGKGDASRMYGQGIVTLALAEAYGVENSRERRLVMRAAIAKLLGVILAAQQVAKSEIHAGGWGATPDATDSDLWMTGWNAAAVRACHDAGFNVPKESVDRAAQYVLKCRNPLDKGFAYLPGAPGQPATTGIGIVSLALLDSGARKEVAEAAAGLVQPAGQAPARYALYSKYFTTQAALRIGEPAWTAAAMPALEALLKAQSPDGGWPASATPEEPGRPYATAMAVLTLSTTYQLLPLYQR